MFLLNKHTIFYFLLAALFILEFIFFDEISQNRKFFLVEFGYVSLSLFKLILFLSIWMKTAYHKKISHFFNENSYINAPVSSKILSAYRIVLGLLLLVQALEAKEYIDLINFDLSLAEVNHLKASWWVWVICIMAVILGLPGRLFYLLSYLGVTYYFDPTVGTNLLQIASFWLIFMGTTNDSRLTISSKIPFLRKLNKYSPPSTSWSVYMLACNFILIISSAGLSKFFDPFWINGYGFYYTFMQPWIKHPFFNFLLNSESLMKIMSYLTIMSEIIVCLFLIKKYRWIGFFAMISMFFLLTFVMRIDPIGPVGLTICLGLASIIFYKKNLEAEKPTKIKTYYSYLFLFSLLGFFKTVIIANPFIDGRVGYPKISFPYSKETTTTEIKIKGSNPYSKKNIKSIYQNAKASYFWSFNFIDNLYPILGGFYSPFNFKHFLARFYYRIDFYNSEGEQLVNKSNFNLFEFDGTMHKKAWYSRILEQRVLSNRMWKIQMIHRDLLYDKGINEKDILFAKALFNHFAIKQHINPKDIRAILKIKLIELPYSFKGNVMPWKKSPWIDFISFDNEKDSLSILETKSYQEYFNNINSFEALKNISPITYE